MNLVTTHSRPKQFAWSYSKLKNFETCPKRYYEIDVTKHVKEAPSESLTWGDEVHKKAASRIKDGIPLPKTMEFIEPWIQRILANSESSKILVEQQYAITKDFAPTEWFGKDVWFRSIADVLKINGDVALAVDWKTGKILEDSVQLALCAGCIFVHYPSVNAVRTKFIWLKEDAESKQDFKRSDMPAIWRSILPRIVSLEEATNTTTFPAKPGGLCRKYCPVSSCPHYQIG